MARAGGACISATHGGTVCQESVMGWPGDTHGGTVCQESVMGWPGDLLGAAGLWCEDCLLAFSSQPWYRCAAPVLA